MAKSLVDSMSAKWNPEKYKDDYREALMEVIEEKVESGGKEIEERTKESAQANENNRSGFSVAEELGSKPAVRKKRRPNRVGNGSGLQRKRLEMNDEFLSFVLSHFN